MAVKKSVKITKEQYNRIFASKLLKENFSIEEPIGQEIRPETQDLISMLYGKSELSPLLVDKGFTRDEICGFLTNKGLVVKKNGIYEIPKSLGTPQDALKQIQVALDEIIGETSQEEQPMSEEPQYDPAIENSGFEEENVVEINGPLSTISSNDEISIVTDGNNLFTFNYSDMGMEPLSDEELNQYVSLNPKQVGYGLNSWLDGTTKLIQIDDDLKSELEVMYSGDEMLNVLSPSVEESPIPMTQPPVSIEEPSIIGNKVIDKLKQLKQEDESLEMSEPEELEEMTSAGSSATGGSSGPFTAPLNFGNGEDETDIIRKNVPIVAEMTDTSSSGPYDTNALPNISRDGSFKTPKKSKAEVKTQWADGGFVEFNDCTKLNNKTSSTGCSGGAVDNVVSIKKSNGNINAPSLNEMRILVTIAQKTGKSIKEIKTIIDSKKPKA